MSVKQDRRNKKVLVNLGTIFSCLLFYYEYTVKKRARGKGKEDKQIPELPSLTVSNSQADMLEIGSPQVANTQVQIAVQQVGNCLH